MSLFTFTFTFMHLADAFIQSDLHCIQVTVFFFYILSTLAFPGIEPMILALLVPCSTSWATGKLFIIIIYLPTRNETTNKDQAYLNIKQNIYLFLFFLFIYFIWVNMKHLAFYIFSFIFFFVICCVLLSIITFFIILITIWVNCFISVLVPLVQS